MLKSLPGSFAVYLMSFMFLCGLGFSAEKSDHVTSYVDIESDKPEVKSENNYYLKLYVLKNKSTGRFVYLLGTDHGNEFNKLPTYIAKRLLSHFRLISRYQKVSQKTLFLAVEKPLHFDRKPHFTSNDPVIKGINSFFVDDGTFPAYAMDARSDFTSKDVTEFMNCIVDQMSEVEDVFITQYYLREYFFKLAKFILADIDKLSPTKGSYFYKLKTMIQEAQSDLENQKNLYSSEEKLITPNGWLERLFDDMFSARIELYFLNNLLDINRSALVIAGDFHSKNIMEEMIHSGNWQNILKNGQNGILLENEQQFLKELDSSLLLELRETKNTEIKFNKNGFNYRKIKNLARLLGKLH